MTHDDHMDDLDRAIFALPLDEPPAGLRESILRATVFAPAVVPSPAMFGRIEAILVGVILAVGVWLALVLVTNPHAAESLAAAVSMLTRGLAGPMTVAWLATGALTALVLSSPGSLGLPFRNGRAS
jgi:hypothetical protein